MRTALMRLATLFFVYLLTACHSDPASKSGLAGSGVDRARICAEGGGTLAASSNECSCPDAQKWNGSRCEASAVAANLPAETKAVEKPTIVPPHVELTESTETTEHAEPEPAAEEPVRGKDLRAVCVGAGAHFDGKNRYCHCPGGDVLIGATCRSFAGQVNEMACKGVQHPGHWFKSHCDCAPGKEFIPGRGGCVSKSPMSQTTRRRICESSINRGKWDVRTIRCDCGPGRVWNDALCDEQASIPSRDVCESDFNLGSWDKEKKRCNCPQGRIWVDQSCKLAGSVEAQAACVGETNGGIWVAAASRCDCPPRIGHGGVWDATAKLCR